MSEEMELRFGGIERLYSAEGLRRLKRARVCVVGIGGVGSWAAEALARSGVGRITLVDLDDVCVSNVNRQLHALDGTIGRPKVDVMAERIRAINPACEVNAMAEFFNEATEGGLLRRHFDWVVDAIDQVPNKCRLIAGCVGKQIPIIAIGGAGGRRNPLAIQVADLAQAGHDRLLRETRKKLREEHGFPRDLKMPFDVPTVFSREAAEFSGGSKGKANLRMTCDTGYGTASFVTGTFGFVAAGHVVTAIAAGHGDAGPDPSGVKT